VESWEIAESALPKLRCLIHSIPHINNPILEEIRRMSIPQAEVDHQQPSTLSKKEVADI
jgi:hypothetical protein